MTGLEWGLLLLVIEIMVAVFIIIKHLKEKEK